MKGDFSRNTFDAKNHFSRVLMQQGRVQLDADWNEQASILLHYLRALAADLIGEYGGPDANAGFEIIGDPTLANDFLIGPGRYYVDGILCELDAGVLHIDRFTLDEGKPPTFTVPSTILDDRQLATNDRVEIADDKGWHAAQITGIDSSNRTLTVALTDPNVTLQNPVQLRRLWTYRQQLDYPGAQLDGNSTLLVYLDVWERHVTSIEDGRIREVALGGPDTATRAKVTWQVKVAGKEPDGTTAIPAGTTKDQVKAWWPQWVDAWKAQANGQLAVQLDPGQVKPDPCTIPPTSAYRGQENQLYRVEIHVGGNVQDGRVPTFKWSRDNGSSATAWLGVSEDGGLLVGNTHGFSAGQWAEITGKDNDLSAKPGDFFKISRVEGGALYLETSSTPLPAWKQDQLQKIRRWDQTDKTSLKLIDTGGAVPITTRTDKADWIDLESGLQVQFQIDRNYRTGDYWLVPARTAGTIEWPVERGADGQPTLDTSGHPIPIAEPPHGITHHYAPLWIISVDKGVTATPDNDLRCTFKMTVTC